MAAKAAGPAGPSADKPEGSAPQARKKRRRWLWVLLGVLAALIVLVWVAPYLVSTPTGTRLLLSAVKARLKGEVEIDDLSISWLGPTYVEGLRVRDPAGEEVLKIKKVNWAGGIWRAVFSGEDFGRIDVDSPDVTLRVDKDGRISLKEAFESRPRPEKKKRRRKRGKQREEEPPLRPTGRVVVSSGAVRVVMADGRRIEVPSLRVQLDLTEQDEATSAVAYEVEVSRLSASRPEGRRPRPIDLRLSGTVRLGQRDADADARLTGPAGELHLRAAFPLSAAKIEADAAGIVSAVTRGERLVLPEFEFGAAGRLDLAAVAAAVPALLPLRKDVELDAATLAIREVSVRGGSAPAAKGGIELTGLRAKRGGKTLTFKPIHAWTDVLLEEGTGLRVNRASLEAEFAQIAAAGTPASMNATFRADLTGLRRQMGEVLDLGQFDLGGSVRGRLQTTGLTEDRIDLAFEAQAESLQYRPPGKKDKQPGPPPEPLRVRRAAVEQAAGYLTFFKGRRKPKRFTLTGARLAVDGSIVVGGSGWYEFDDRSFQSEAKADRVDLAYVSARARALGSDLPGRFGGVVAFHARAARAGKDAPVTTTGTATVAGLRLDDKPLSRRDVKLRWTGVQVDPERKLYAAKEAVLEGDVAEFTARQVHCRLGEDLAAAGAFALTADLARCVALARPFVESRKLPALTGRVIASGTCATKDGKIGYRVGCRVTDRRAGRAADEAVLALSGDGVLDAKRRILLARAEMPRLDLGWLGPHGEALGAKELARYAGTVAMRARVEQLAPDAPVTSAGSVTVRDLRVDGKPLTGKPLELRWEQVEVDRKKKFLAAGLARLDSDLADFTARGVRCRYGKDLSAAGRVNLTADLGKCLAAAAPIAKWKKTPAVEGVLTTSGTCTTRGKTLRFAGGGQVRPAEGADPAVAWRVSGSYDPGEEAFAADARLERADLSYIARQAKAAGLGGLTRYAGVVTMNAKAARASGKAPFLADGAGAVRGLRVDGKPLAADQPDVTFTFSGVRYAPEAKSLGAALVKLDSALAALTAKDVDCRLGKEPSVAGQVNITADLGQCLAAATPIAKWKKTPPVAGRFAWTGRAETHAGKIALAGSGGVDDFQYRAKEHTFRQKRMTFGVAADVHPKADEVLLRRLTFHSPVLSATVRGSVKQLGTDRLLDLRGQYRGDLEELTALLHAFKPATAGMIALKGKPEYGFEVTGPASRPKVRPAYRGVRGEAKFGWASGEVQAVELGKAELSPSLDDGRMVLPVAEVPAGGGTARLGCTVDLTGKRPYLNIPGTLQVMQDVPLDIDLRKKEHNLLRWINPIFRNRMRGKVSLRVTDIALPLADSIKTTGTGAGRLDLKDLRIESKGLLAELVELGGLKLAGLHKVRTDGLDFRIRNGRIEYDNFTLVFTEVFDLKFDGSVGFDETLNMRVWVPVTPALLEKLLEPLGLKVPERIGGILGRVRHVQIPIGGTIKKPKLDLTKVDVKKLLPILPGLLDTLLKPKPKPKPEPGAKKPPATRPATRPAEKKPEEKLIEGLFDLLKKQLEEK